MRHVQMMMCAAMMVALTAIPAAVADDPLSACKALGYAHVDAFPSTGAATFRLDVAALPNLDRVPGINADGARDIVVKFDEGTGDTVVCRSEPFDTDGDRVPDRIDVEMLSMQLQGTVPGLGTVTVTEDPLMPSRGVVQDFSLDPVTGETFGGVSFFDIFFEVEFELATGHIVGGRNCLDPTDPFRCAPFIVTAELWRSNAKLPPVAEADPPYMHPPGAAPIVWRTDGTPLGEISGGCHKPFLSGVPGHRICLLATGKTSLDATGDACLGNPVDFGVIDLSSPAHTLSGVVTFNEFGPHVLTPWTLTTKDGEPMWVASSTTASLGCAPNGVELSGTFMDGHVSAMLGTEWRQHA